MPPSKILVDSSFLFPLHDQNNDKHREAVELAKLYRARLIIPDVVLTEATFLFRRAGGVVAVLKFLDSLISSRPQFEPLTLEDLARVREIMAAYRDARLDFVDCCIMAIAERLTIRQICTFDRRDFAIVRLKHIETLDILP